MEGLRQGKKRQERQPGRTGAEPEGMWTESGWRFGFVVLMRGSI